MTNTKEFPFKKARRVTKKETESAKKAIEKATGTKRKGRGRPPKETKEKYVPISIRLHPKILTWAKKEAKKKGLGYQELINKILLRASSKLS